MKLPIKKIDRKNDRYNVYNKYDGHCSYCGREIKYMRGDSNPKQVWESLLKKYHTDDPHGRYTIQMVDHRRTIENFYGK